MAGADEGCEVSEGDEDGEASARDERDGVEEGDAGGGVDEDFPTPRDESRHGSAAHGAEPARSGSPAVAADAAGLDEVEHMFE